MSAQEVHDVLVKFRLPPVLERLLPTLPGDDLARPDDDREGDADVPFVWTSECGTGD